MKHQTNSTQEQDIPLTQVSVIRMHAIGSSGFLLTVPKLASFTPGQVIGISTNTSIPARLFSICSGKDDPHWEILFNIKPDGVLSPQLANLSNGDPIYVSMPFGSFTDTADTSWWIAAGTGIAPFRSMLRSGLGNTKHLLHGARSSDSFYFADECATKLGDKYVRCVSQGNMDNAYSGRLTNWLREKNDLPQTIPYLLCGSAEMVVEVRDILISKGIPFDNIRAEIYF